MLAHVKYLWAVLTVVGLTLAGCGGSSHNHDDDDKLTGNTSPKTLKLPSTATKGVFSLNENGDKADFEIAAGKTEMRGGHDFSCPETSTGGCKVYLENNAGTLVAMETGGVLEVKKTPDEAVTSTGRGASQPTNSTDPLSNDVLLEALKGTGSEKTVWSGAGASIQTNQSVTRTFLEGEILKLWLKGDVNAYYGYWIESKDATSLADPDADPMFVENGVVFGGSKPYGIKPNEKIDEATYNGNVILTHRVNSDADWSDPETSTIALKANFGDGMIGGSFTHSDTGEIVLMDTSIKTDGTFAGTAKFSDEAFKRQNGNWNGGFFGDTTEIDGDKEVHKAPSDVAGAFDLHREKVDASKGSLQVRGAFGS